MNGEFENCPKCGMPEHSSCTCRIADRDIAPDETEICIDPSHFPLDFYKPLRILGKGGAGAVFLGRDRVSNQLVAVKVLHELDAEQLVTFENEANAISNVKHASIVQLLDFGATPAGLPYLVLEYFDGISLLDFIDRNGPLSIDSALNMFSTLAEGLELAHSKGVFHRDISSSNILVRRTSDADAASETNRLDVKLIDFGVAHVNDEGLDTQQLLLLAGTPAYMAPDLANDLPFDARSEIYSLGCLMFETLTGDVPFLGRSAMETINMHATAQPPTLFEQTGKQFPPSVENIVSTCLAKEQTDRFQSMRELQQALLAVIVKQSESDKNSPNALQ